MVVASNGPSAGSAGEQQNSVVGGGVAVDGNAIEGAGGGVVEQICSSGGFELCVGEEIDQHGGMQSGRGCGLQLRMDHARTLGDTRNANGYPIYLEVCRGNFR